MGRYQRRSTPRHNTPVSDEERNRIAALGMQAGVLQGVYQKAETIWAEAVALIGKEETQRCYDYARTIAARNTDFVEACARAGGLENFLKAGGIWE